MKNWPRPLLAQARARANQASKFEVCEYGDHYCYSPGKYNWKPSLLEHCSEVAVLLGETHFNGPQGQESDPWIILW